MLWCCMRHLVVSNIYTPKTLPSFDTEEEGMAIWGVCWEFFWHFVGNAFRFHDVPCVKWWFKWLVHFSLEIPMISKFQAVKRAEMFNTVHEAGVYKRWWSTWSIKFECSAWKRNTTTWTSRDLGPKKVVRKLPPPARASVFFVGNWTMSRQSSLVKYHQFVNWTMKKNPGCLGYSYYPVMWGLQQAIIRIPMKQPGLHGK